VVGRFESKRLTGRFLPKQFITAANTKTSFNAQGF
jgi:hypothetical protein